MRSISLIRLTAIAACLSLSGCVIHVGSGGSAEVSSIFGEVSVSPGKTVDDVTSVNGDITLSDDVTADEVNNVNGDIDLGENVTVYSISSVNGDVTGDKNLTIQRQLSSVNGDIRLAQGTLVEGGLDSVNGDITLYGTKVKQNITVKNTDIVLHNGSVVSGDIVYKPARSRSWNNEPTLRIDESSEVLGSIILHREVELIIENEAMRDKVVRRYGE